MTLHRTLLPEGWPRPSGYANGILARGSTIWTGGLIGWNEHGRFAGPDLPSQLRQTLANIVAVLAAGGASPEHMVRMTWYLTDVEAYAAQLDAVGAAWRDVIGRVYPAMAVVGVTRLVEPEALIEIETVAVIPD